jgi:hypothetical protein
MVQTARRCLILLLCWAGLAPAQRVILISLDGMGTRLLADDPASAELPALRALARAGTQAEGLVSAFPSTTANSHAVLWTGAYGDVNGVTANSHPLLPRSAHTFDERTNGFRSDGLTAEPIWVAAARQGVPTIAHQVTQAIPFTARNTAPGATIINNYQSATHAPHLVLRARDVRAEAVAGWRPALPPSRLPVKAFTWKAGPVELHGALLASGAAAYDALVIAADRAGERVTARAAPLETAPPKARPLARHFSAGLFLAEPTPAWLYFRLFELAPDGAEFLLYQTPLQETGWHDGTPREAANRLALLRSAGGFLGNGPYNMMQRGELGPAGIGERRYLEIAELVVRQNLRYTEELAKRRDARLLIGYLNYPDEFDHTWLGNGEEALGWRRWGYAAINHYVEGIARLAGPRDHLVITSDHGMAPVSQGVSVDAVLAGAGLTERAKHVYNSVLVNTTDWRGGLVPLTELPATVERIRAALAGVSDPRTGAPVFTAFFPAAEFGPRFGIAGPATMDLYFDLAPGYHVVDGKQVIEKLRAPGGAHGFLPERPDMHALLIARGPRFAAGGRWPVLRSTAVAPLVAELLGIEPPRDSRGVSPLAIRSSKGTTP